MPASAGMGIFSFFEELNMQFIKCPLCGKSDIEYGVHVCSGCQAEIRYGSKSKGIKAVALGAIAAWLGFEFGAPAFIFGGICIALGIVFLLDKQIHFERRKFR